MAAVVLTQPQPRADGLARQLRQAGLDPFLLTFQRLEPLAAARAQLAQLAPGRHDRILFVSPSAVAFAAASLPRLAGLCPDGIAAVGAGTEARLLDACPGLQVIRPAAPPYDADALLALPEMQTDAFEKLWVVRGVCGREDWIAGLRAGGKAVEVIALYKQHDLAPTAAMARALGQLAASGQAALIMVSSTALAAQLCRWVNQQAFAPWLRRQTCLVSHPRVARLLTDAGFTSTVSADAGDRMIGSAIQWWQNRSSSPS